MFVERKCSIGNGCKNRCNFEEWEGNGVRNNVEMEKLKARYKTVQSSTDHKNVRYVHRRKETQV